MFGKAKKQQAAEAKRQEKLKMYERLELQAIEDEVCASERGDGELAYMANEGRRAFAAEARRLQG